MACGCKGKTAQKVKYVVTFKDGRKVEEFDTSLQAHSAARKAGGGVVRAKQR